MTAFARGILSLLPVVGGLLLAMPPAAGAEAVRRGPVAVKPGDRGVGGLVPALAYADIAGGRHRVGDAEGATVFAATSTSCPLSKKFLPTLAALAADHPTATFVLVNPTVTDPEADIRAAAERLDVRGHYVHDVAGDLARGLGLTTTTDVVVIDAARTVVYRGAVDDQYGLGYALEAPRRTYLADALVALAAGRRPAIAATDAPGCALDLAEAAAPAEVTYHGRIARLVQRHCVECHRDGGAAPFPLDSLADVAAHAGMIREVVENGTMPPWFAGGERAEQGSRWANDRSLAAAEKADLLGWLAGGRPAGDPADAPPRLEFPGGWGIGEPDAIWEFAEPVAVKATGTMPYRTVVVETNLPEDRWVRAIEVRPGAAEVVHHVLVHLVDDAGGGPRDEAARERGGFWAEYVPGQSVLEYPPGFAKRLPKGARLAFQMHYTPNGTATTDRTRLGVVFCDEPEHEVLVTGIASLRIAIPPHAANHREVADVQLPGDATVLAFLPHMHLRGKACRYDVVHGDGPVETLLDVPRYDFNWQLLYRLAEPLPLFRGDRIVFTAWYDNSAGNPANPDPTQEVRWGPQTFDEMHLGYVEYFVPGVAPGDPQPSLRRGSGGLRDRARP